MVNILLWIIFGGIAGWIASQLMGRDKQMGLIANVIVGIIGAFIGGFIIQTIGGAGFTGFNIWSLLVAVFGAVVLLWLLRVLRRAS